MRRGKRRTTVPVWKAFQESDCVDLVCSLTQVRLGRAVVSKLRGCFTGKRRNMPFRFGAVWGREASRASKSSSGTVAVQTGT